MATTTTTTETNATTYTPTAQEQEQYDTIFKVLADWGTVGDKLASENMLLAGAIALINRANSNAHQYKQYNRCMDYDTLVSDIKGLKAKNQAAIQMRTGSQSRSWWGCKNPCYLTLKESSWKY